MLVAGILGSLVLCVQVAVALRPNGRLNRATPIAPIPEEALSEGPVVSRNGTQLPPYSEFSSTDVDCTNREYNSSFFHRYNLHFQPVGMTVTFAYVPLSPSADHQCLD